jgi:hypothetical protein
MRDLDAVQIWWRRKVWGGPADSRNAVIEECVHAVKRLEDGRMVLCFADVIAAIRALKKTT